MLAPVGGHFLRLFSYSRSCGRALLQPSPAKPHPSHRAISPPKTFSSPNGSSLLRAGTFYPNLTRILAPVGGPHYPRSCGRSPSLTPTPSSLGWASTFTKKSAFSRPPHRAIGVLGKFSIHFRSSLGWAGTFYFLNKKIPLPTELLANPDIFERK